MCEPLPVYSTKHIMKLALKYKTHLFGNIWSFTFSPAQPFTWAAGQFIKIGLPHDEADGEGTSRFFTIAGAPHEKLPRITTRITDTTFKQRLASLEPGNTVDLLDMPAGDFLWRPSQDPHIFAAQGIGITPFYAIIKDRIHHNLPVAATLLYAHNQQEPPAFEHELAEWATQDSTLNVIFQTEYITPEHLDSLYPELQSHLVYVSGPKSLVSLCLPPYNLPANNFKQDNFPGYAASSY